MAIPPVIDNLTAIVSFGRKTCGRKKVVMGSLTFYYDTVDGYNVITWASGTREMTYAMVYDVGERPQQSCIVCHARPGAKGAEDRDLMRGLLEQ